MIFGDSLSDQGRRFEAPASFEFEDIGVVPWKKIFAANDSEVRVLPVKNEIRGLKPKTGACYILHKAHTRNILVSIFRPSFSLSVQIVVSCGPSCFLLFSIVFFPFILDVEFVGRTSRGHKGQTGFLIHLLSAVHALIFLARRIHPFLSLVDREVEFCVLTI